MLANSLIQQSRTNSVEGLDELIQDITNKLEDIRSHTELVVDNSTLTVAMNADNQQLLDQTRVSMH